MQIETGKIYAGPFKRRRQVVAIEGEVVRYALRGGLREESCSLAEFEAWAVSEYEEPGA